MKAAQTREGSVLKRDRGRVGEIGSRRERERERERETERERGGEQDQESRRLNLQLAGQGGVIWTRIGCRGWPKM